MKRFTIIFTALILCVSNVVMAQKMTRKMESAAEKYVKAWVRADPGMSEGKRSSEAREEAMKILKGRKVLEVDAATEKKLKKREEVVSDAQLNSGLDGIKELKDKETDLLRTLVASGKLKGEPRLLIHRLISFKNNELKKAKAQELSDARAAREDALRDLYKHFKSRSAELNKPPINSTELALPEELVKFNEDTDWLFLGGPLRKYTTKKGRLVFIEPVGDAEGKAFAITDLGNVVTLDATIYLKKVLENEAKLNKLPQPTPADEKKEANKNDPSVADEYDAKVGTQLRKMLQLVAKNSKDNRKMARTLAEVGIVGDDAVSVSKDGSQKAKWHFLGDRVKADVGNGKFVIIIAPFVGSDGSHLAVLNDGVLARLKPAQVKQITDALEQAPKPTPKPPKKKDNKEEDFVPQ